MYTTYALLTSTYIMGKKNEFTENLFINLFAVLTFLDRVRKNWNVHQSVCENQTKPTNPTKTVNFEWKVSHFGDNTTDVRKASGILPLVFYYEFVGLAISYFTATGS